MTTRQYIASFCTILMVCTLSAPMMSKLTCNHCGNVERTVGYFDSCCASTPSNGVVFRDICYEVEKLSVQLDDMPYQTFSFDEDVLVVPMAISPAFADPFVLEYHFDSGLRAPPLLQRSVQSLFCVFRL